MRRLIALMTMGLACVLFLQSSIAEEKITLTTYYPAPYGVYKELRADQMSVGSGYRTQALTNGALIVEGNVGIGTNSPQAKLDINSTTSGFLPPRMNTTERDAMTVPAGSMIYNTVTNQIEYFNGTIWKEPFSTAVFGVWDDTNGDGIGDIVIEKEKNYLATTDGLVVCQCEIGCGDKNYLGYTYSSAMPTSGPITSYTYNFKQGDEAAVGTTHVAVMPVKNGEYWQLRHCVQDGCCRWMPIGN